jgi:hypothetical protein
LWYKGESRLLTEKTLTQFKLNIAGVIMKFSADDNINLRISDIDRRFIVSRGKPDLHLKVHYGPLPPLKLKEKLFDSGAVWALYRSDGMYEMTFSSDVVGPVPYQVAVIAPAFESGDLYVRPVATPGDVGQPGRDNHDERYSVNPTAYPLDEVFMVNLLARGRGVELHSCGVNYKGHGLIFTGTSGAGKSTISRLWQDEKDTILLSDERIIVRKTGDRFRMYGTPWLSDARIASPEGVPLERIFFLKHSPENKALSLKAGDAASRLFVRCFPTFWDETCLNFTLDFIGQLAEQIPCYELGFVPDKSILDFGS